MAKIGYIMAAAHYDKLEEDRQWMQEYGCVKIVEENDADEKSRPLWKQLMIALERGDELVISKFQQCPSWRTGTGNVPGILPSESHSGNQHT